MMEAILEAPLIATRRRVSMRTDPGRLKRIGFVH
jgi:hypothetical protein